MKHKDVLMVRIYLTEGRELYKTLLTRLHDVEKVRGLTVFRGVSGFGASGKPHPSGLVDLALDMPVVVEFFDEPVKAELILDRLKDILPAGHVVSWFAKVNET